MVGQDVVIDRFPTRRSALLLARVALSRSGRVGRDDLAEILWPDDFIDSTRLRLRQELNRLRETLGPASEIIVSDRSWVSIDLDKATIDVREFGRLIAASETQAKGLELYAGPLLPASEEDWAVAERLEWQAKFLATLTDRAQALLDQGENQEALTLALRAVRSNPSHEAARMIAMRAFAAMGDLGGAMRLFQDFERALQRDFGVTPSAGIVELAEELRQSSPQRSTIKEPAPNEEPTGTAPLPVYLDQRVGREDEVKLLIGWFTNKPAVRLATITGPGGVGKTRLATEAAKAIAEEIGIRAVFVGLADLEPGKKVVPKLLDAFGMLGSSESREPIPGLGSQKCLVLLDNAEHVLDEARQTAREILLAHPNVQIIVTSRQKLGLGGEQELPLAPLEAPGPLEGAEGLEDSTAAKLFMLRASSVKPGYLVPEGQGEALAMLLERLDGLPLAIELAAARAGFLTPSQMLDEIDDRFTFLVTRRADVSARQSSLRATIDWSFLGLSEDLKSAMGQLAVFRGGWSMELAKAVLERDAMDVMQNLLDRSLIYLDEVGGESRFGMLETIRDYVIADLDPEVREECRRNHAAVMAKYLAGASRKLFGPDQNRWYEAMRTELDNSHIAIEWAAEHDGETASLLGLAMWRYWCARGLPREAAYYLDRILAFPDQPKTPAWAETYLGRGKIAGILGDDELASEWFAKSIGAFDQEDQEWARCWARFNLANSKFDEGRIHESAKCAEEAMPGANKYTVHFVQFALSRAYIRLGQLEKGIALAEEAFAAMVGDIHQASQGWPYAGLAEAYREAGQSEPAYGLLLEAVERLRKEMIRDYLLEALVWLTQEELRRERWDPFEEHLAEAKVLAREVNQNKSEMLILAMEARAAALRGDVVGALAHYEDSVRKVRPRGGSMTLLAIARDLAQDLVRFGQVDQARTVLGAESGLREAIGCPLSARESSDLAPVLAGFEAPINPESTGSSAELSAVCLKAIAGARAS